MECLTDTGLGSFVVANPQPTDYTICTYLLVSPTELQPSVLPPLSAAQGVTVGLAILAVWATAAGFRLVYQSLKNEE